MLHNLDVFFSNVSYSQYVFKTSFIDAMNEDSTGLYNRIGKVLEHAKASKTIKDAKDTLYILQTKLTGLESDSGQAKQLIMDSVLKKESKLAEIIDNIKFMQEYLRELTVDKQCLKIYQSIMENLETLQSEYTTWKKVYFLKAEIAYFTGFLDSVNDSKTKINEKLRELDQIIKEQDNYLVRLNDEVNPELEKLKSQQVELSAVESQLSPTKGISHTYIIRYINSIFKLANQFISRVWSYPMALEYIDENDESFDYSFKLNINESSSIKDINIASAGQKSIINLCVMLAICIFRHYGNDYPIILDEVTVNMSLNHQNSLITFLNELFSDEGLKQIFIVDHCIDVCSSFASIAEMICLSRDFDIGQEWKRIGTIE
jgi:DNA repair ATPase RecN